MYDLKVVKVTRTYGTNINAWRYTGVIAVLEKNRNKILLEYLYILFNIEITI